MPGTKFTAIVLLGALASLPTDHGDLLPPDNTAQYVTSPSLTPRGVVARNQGMAQLNRSDINTAFGSGDIYVADNFYDATWWGYAQCTQRTNNLLRCDLWTVSFNERTLPADDYWWRKVGCHEFGHTGGLGHRTSADDTDTNSCMREGRVSVQQLDSHDLNQINSRV